jgi:hypothetical protein
VASYDGRHINNLCKTYLSIFSKQGLLLDLISIGLRADMNKQDRFYFSKRQKSYKLVQPHLQEKNSQYIEIIINTFTMNCVAIIA